jgi:hypothetical protein
VVLRALATLAAIAVPLLLMIDAVSDLLRDLVWVGPALAAALALPLVLAAKHARGQALIGAGLAALAAAATPELPEQFAITRDEQTLVIHDLREGPLPAEQHGHVAVRGFLRSDWQVDEYRVQPGERPDQNEQAEAVLVPLLGTDAAIIEVEGSELERVIVARVAPTQLGTRSLVTLRGRLGPVSPEIVDSLFAVQIDAKGRANATMLRPDAVLLDTLDVPTRGQAITRLLLAIAAGVLGLVLLWLSLPRAVTQPPESKPT